MRKILALILTLSMLVTNVLPIYASTTDTEAKKALFLTAQKTFEQINSTYYSDEYLKNYESTFEKFLTQLSNTPQINIDADYTYNYDDLSENMGVTFDYNDDGSSILVNFAVTTNYDGEDFTTKGTFYVDDKKIVINYDEISDQPIVYNFGDSLAGTYLEGLDMNYLKYSSIKNYLKLFLDLETKGKLEAIEKDYENNLLEYIAKADFTYENNTVTMTIDADLINEYLIQLANKIQNDENSKAIYDTLGITDYSYTELSDDIAYVITDLAESVGNSFEFKYVGVIENGVFAKNKFIFTFDEAYETTVDFNFNDVKNGILSDGEIIYDDGYDNFNVSYSLKENGNNRTLVYKATANNEVISTGNVKYTLNGLTYSSTGEVLTYSEPYFFVTEEPSSTPLSKEEWINSEISSYDNYISDLSDSIKYATKQITNIESNSNTTYLDLSDDNFYDFYYNSYDFIDSGYDVADYVNYDDGKVLNKNGTIDLLNSWLIYLNEQVDYLTDAKNSINETANEEYQNYIESFNTEYEYDLKQYNEYKNYIANGSPKDVLKQIISTSSTLSEEQLTSNQKQEIYENDKLQTSSLIDFIIKKSTTKNTTNTTNAISFVTFLTEY